MQIFRIISAILIIFLLNTATSALAANQSPAVTGLQMHPSWDLDGDTINDCELDDTCDHTIDYSKPRMSPATPSFDCNKAQLNSSEIMVCKDPRLSILDRKLNQVFRAAKFKVEDTNLPTLKAEQRGWIKGRDDCWKAEDHQQCVYKSYLFRIAELQAWYRLVPANGPVRYLCEGTPKKEVDATFFGTDPPTLITEYQDSPTLMYIQPSGSGAKYQGRNETFWEHQGEAMITWGYDAVEMRCKIMP